jgi:hypothetical protein
LERRIAMPDREKVIRGLEWCIKLDGNGCSLECPYLAGKSPCPNAMLRDALALLKEQEARVLEYSEIEKHPLVWLEDNDKENVIPALFLQYNGWNAEFLRQAPDEYVSSLVRSATVYAVEKAYGMMWRAWSTQPDEQVRRDTPWES